MRGLILVIAGALLSLGAQAQAPLADERQALTCLVKGEPNLQLAEAQLQPTPEGPPAYVRVRLVFERADRPPVAEVLASTASAQWSEAVLAHVAGYRLPCLGARPVAAMQEFQFASDLMPNGGPLVVVRGPASADRGCVTKPTSFLYRAEPRVIERALIDITFSGNAEEPPSVQVLRSTGGEDFTRAIVNNARERRQPCRKADDWPSHEQLLLQLSMAGTHAAHFKKQRVTLAEFVGYMKDGRDQPMFFDFDTMQCPFALRWTLHEPWGRNAVRELDAENPNRAGLVEWLKQLHSGLQPEAMERLLGESLVIDVPCGRWIQRPVR